MSQPQSLSVFHRNIFRKYFFLLNHKNLSFDIGHIHVHVASSPSRLPCSLADPGFEVFEFFENFNNQKKIGKLYSDRSSLDYLSLVFLLT